MPNPAWSIAFGDYELIVDRKALTYRLTETKSGTLWADGLSLGWVALEDRETGEITRHAFGEMTQFSVSEKAGPQGKRILFGLDIHGIPIDIYLICSLREIQMVVEANRDSKTHKIAEFCLLPGLCSVPEDGRSCLVIPYRGGALLFPDDAPSVPHPLPIWDMFAGVVMPFVGAVRGKTQTSALALITDSAYGTFYVARRDDYAEVDIRYKRDPERRRLDMRVVFLPGGDHISIARTYREKLISENGHTTLRRKVRENPRVEQLLGSAWLQIEPGPDVPDSIAFAEEWKNTFPEFNSVFFVRPNTWRGHTLHAVFQALDHLRQQGFLTVILPINEEGEDIPEINALEQLGGEVAQLFFRPLSQESNVSRWEAFENKLAEVKLLHEKGVVVGGLFTGDWPYYAIDFERLTGRMRSSDEFPFPIHSVPLLSTVYHDSLVFFERVAPTPHGVPMLYFLGALLMLCCPDYRTFPHVPDPIEKRFHVDQMHRTYAVLGPLHRLTFAAFLTAHRFLTPDFQAEEAVYSDKTRVVINQSETETYEGEDVTLPPLGFYVRHAQMEAHDALRVGDRTFATRAWRIARSQDGKPLEQSEDVLQQDFPVEGRPFHGLRPPSPPLASASGGEGL